MSHLKQFEHLKMHLEGIKSIINNFADENYIRMGGFGRVYKGEIVHSTGLRSQKFFLMVSFFMDTPVYSNPELNLLDRLRSSRVKSHNKNKYYSKSTMSLNKNA
ncbi:hypothetical protein HanPI659440_Chr04g0157011 [Helianthus annuus]|nr:hypothetical protein HanPI659440_Chr04g0157011 [Helianthus annuus]